MLAEGVWRYVQATQDLELARLFIPWLEREYHQFWDVPPRKTPTGLATHFDCGDPRRREALAAEAESGEISRPSMAATFEDVCLFIPTRP